MFKADGSDEYEHENVLLLFLKEFLQKCMQSVLVIRNDPSSCTKRLLCICRPKNKRIVLF